jgi:hypothetical protein
MTNAGELISYNMNGFRIAYGNYGFIIRNDGANTWFLLTNSGDAEGDWKKVYPMQINNSTGNVTFRTNTDFSETGTKATFNRIEIPGTTSSGNGCIKYTGEITPSDVANYCVFDSSGILKVYSGSSKRYKHDIVQTFDETTDYKKLLNLPVVTYKYNEDYCPDSNGKVHIGFIAEDMDELFPAGCVYKNEKPEKWNVMEVVPGMLKLIQEHEETINELKEQIKILTETKE